MIYILAFIALHPLLAVLYIIWARTGSKVVALPALVIDVALNYTTASVIWGWPHRGEWTISKRLKRDQARNFRFGVLVADWLNRHDLGHV